MYGWKDRSTSGQNPDLINARSATSISLSALAGLLTQQNTLADGYRQFHHWDGADFN